MHREHNILVRKHLNVSFPDTVKLLKVSGMMYCLIFYLFQLLYLIFFAEDLTPLRGRQICRKFLCFISRNALLFIEAEMYLIQSVARESTLHFFARGSSEPGGHTAFLCLPGISRMHLTEKNMLAMVLSSNVVICSSFYSTARIQGYIASWAETKVSEYLSFGPSVASMCQQGCFIFLAQSLPAALKRR